MYDMSESSSESATQAAIKERLSADWEWLAERGIRLSQWGPDPVSARCGSICSATPANALHPEPEEGRDLRGYSTGLARTRPGHLLEEWLPWRTIPHPGIGINVSPGESAPSWRSPSMDVSTEQYMAIYSAYIYEQSHDVEVERSGPRRRAGFGNLYRRARLSMSARASVIS
jgi:hypothetical protein